MTSPSSFIIIDDNQINNMLCRFIINEVANGFDIQTFNNPEQGFDYIVNKYIETKNETTTVLFLDINMPGWSGWDFLKKFDLLREKVKNKLKFTCFLHPLI